jgi:polyferredoxin
LRADPLTTVFSRLREPWVLLLAAATIVLSFFYRRFWCRNLCPVGAFLSLLNIKNPLGRWFAEPRPGHCDMGVRRADEADCLRCDRCRHAAK